MPFWSASATTLLQELVEPEMQGRVFGVQQFIASSVMPVGMLVFGPVADVVTLELVFVISSALMAIPGVWLYFNGQSRVQDALATQARDVPLRDCADCYRH